MLMKIRMKRGWLIAAILLAVLLGNSWVFSYHPHEFQGGLSIHDSGFFSYPRYYAELGQFPLWQHGDYQFTVQGLPSVPLDLSLDVADVTYEDRAELESLSTFVGVSVTDSLGNPVCEGGGSLSGSWVLASSISGSSFWHNRCMQLPISRSKTYIVKVMLSEVDARSPHRTVTVVMAGGGNELP